MFGRNTVIFRSNFLTHNVSFYQKRAQKRQSSVTIVRSTRIQVFPMFPQTLPIFPMFFCCQVYVGDLSAVLHASAARLARHGVVAFSTEAPPRSGGANEHEGQLAEVVRGGADQRQLWVHLRVSIFFWFEMGDLGVPPNFRNPP